MKKFIKNKFLAEAAEWALTAAGMFVLFLVCQNFIFRSAVVSGPSMEPTLHHGERLIILKLPFLFGSPKRNDVVAFPYKENPSQHFIKRIIGLPGDIIDIQNRMITVNGIELNDEFTNGQLLSIGDAMFPLTVPAGCYFVMGDNRDQSNDSRYAGVGCIAKKDMMGKAVLRFWPLEKFGGI